MFLIDERVECLGQNAVSEILFVDEYGILIIDYPLWLPAASDGLGFAYRGSFVHSAPADGAEWTESVAWDEGRVMAAADLDLSDFGARLYDPFTARWTAPDPLAAKSPSLSPYAYCAGNPVNFIDPDESVIKPCQR